MSTPRPLAMSRNAKKERKTSGQCYSSSAVQFGETKRLINLVRFPLLAASRTRLLDPPSEFACTDIKKHLSSADLYRCFRQLTIIPLRPITIRSARGWTSPPRMIMLTLSFPWSLLFYPLSLSRFIQSLPASPARGSGPITS